MSPYEEQAIEEFTPAWIHSGLLVVRAVAIPIGTRRNLQGLPRVRYMYMYIVSVTLQPQNGWGKGGHLVLSVEHSGEAFSLMIPSTWGESEQATAVFFLRKV
ncbi:hypothetical protein O9929_09965 [Vibrio lentus]|nr:hypothetical protein [Vibrio lentus]